MHELVIAWTIRLLRQKPDVPSSLRLREPAQEHIHLVVLADDLRIAASLANWTLAGVNSRL